MSRHIADNPDSGTERAILEAATDLFYEKGFALTSTTEIARRAGCNQALVHYYFRTKERLFMRIFSDKIGSLISILVDAYKRNAASFDQKIIGVIDAHFDILERNSRLPFLVLTELATNPVRVAFIRQHIGRQVIAPYRRLEADLKSEIAAGRVREMEVTDLFLDILSLDVFPFVVRPALSAALRLSDERFMQLVKRRREMVKRTLLNSLRP